MTKKKSVPLYITFLFAGLNVVVLSYLETYVSPQLGSAFYSLPIDLLIITSVLILSNAPKKKVVDMIYKSGFYGQIGAIIAISSFIYFSGNEERSLQLSITYSLILWAIFNYFFIYLK